MDNNEKISIEELRRALPALSRLMREAWELSEKSWQALDMDGNGYVSFPEFVNWAGPRMSLPLGLQITDSSPSDGLAKSACGIIGCACQGFVRRESVDYLCVCGHRESSHSQMDRDTGEVPYPAYWKCGGIFDFCDLEPVNSALIPLFQTLFDETHLKIWTRDRRKHNTDVLPGIGKEGEKVPSRYEVVDVKRNENSKAWRNYAIRRHFLADQYSTASIKQYDNVRSTVALMASEEIADRLTPACNEWYLFHGSSEKNADHICKSNFRINLAGSTTGTLYGSGAYLCESITKADEYAKPNKNGFYTVLLCRAIGGNVRYTDEVTPDAEDLVQSCTAGSFDCILGDREKARKTYREFVFYDSGNLYTEYVIQYKRMYG
eukprot:TRINITY_DN18853_c0_g3_i1.p1 TRINITY_DN18853_c0_g3~~TRINITY_DN18853_c0_g3_i1.p1  ORF type:complete len:377 (+),score=47.93 TRINITY_DN18853_c0_g3_i1:2-1132(+)